MTALRDQLGQYVYPIHRLDRATSGVLLMALTAEAASAAGRAFSEHQVSKTYLTLTRGFCADEGQIDTPLVPARGRGLPKEHPHAVPQDAITKYRTIDRFELPVENSRYATTRASLVEVHPQTGRFHQIRRHFNYISHPVIGDTSHGDSRQNQIFRTHFGVTRLMLAAVNLSLEHPVEKSPLTISAPLPPSFRNVVELLTLHKA